MRYLIYTLVLAFVLSFSSCSRRVVVAKPGKVTIIKTLPRNYKVVRVRGKRYYFAEGRHYRKTRHGYVLVIK